MAISAQQPCLDTQNTDLRMQVHYLTLEHIVKDAYVEELLAENFALKRELNGRGEAERAALLLQQEVADLNHRLHKMWTEKSSEIEQLKEALAARPIVLAPLEAVAQATARERSTLEAWFRDTQDVQRPYDQSARAAIKHAARLTLAALRRRLERARRR